MYLSGGVLPSPASVSKSSVFISYAREDKEFAEQFKKILSEHGIQVWLDEAELRTLEKWDQEIKNAIFSHDYFQMRDYLDYMKKVIHL